MCTARLVIHVNMAAQRLISFLRCLIRNEPNISTSQYVKGGASASLCTGRPAIFCFPGLPGLRYFTHLNKRLLIAALQLMIQYPEFLSSFKVAPHPP